MATAVMPVTANQYGPIAMQPFGPGQNLIGQQFNPIPSADTTAARGAVSSGLGALGTAPDRGALAQQTFSQLTDATAPQYQQDLRSVGQAAAKYGRIGSGVTTSELGDVALQRQKYLGNLAAQLGTQSAGQTLQDRLQTLGAGQNVLGQLSGLDQTAYGNLVGERGYQQGLSQQAFNNNEQQTGDLLALAGGYGNPNAGIGDIASQYGQQGQANMATGGDILGMIFRNQGQPQPPGKFDVPKYY